MECIDDYCHDSIDKQSELSTEIRQIVDEVYEALGSGHSERIYHNAMEVSLRELNIPYESERHVPIYYKNHVIGMARADIILRHNVVLELKSVKTLTENMISQARKYLHQLKLDTGYLINFPVDACFIAECFEIIS